MIDCIHDCALLVPPPAARLPTSAICHSQPSAVLFIACNAGTQCREVFRLTMVVMQEYCMSDHEASCIIPCLVEKSGHNQVL